MWGGVLKESVSLMKIVMRVIYFKRGLRNDDNNISSLYKGSNRCRVTKRENKKYAINDNNISNNNAHNVDDECKGGRMRRGKQSKNSYGNENEYKYNNSIKKIIHYNKNCIVKSSANILGDINVFDD